MHKKVPYITGFLVRFHRFCNVFDSLYGVFHIWIFGKRGVEVDRHRTWLPRNVRNINIFCKNIFVLFVSWWSFHCREKHDVWDCVNKDLKTKGEDDSCRSVGLCYSCSCALNKDTALPSQIASRAGSATDSLSDYVTAHALVTLGLLSASCPGAEGVTRRPAARFLTAISLLYTQQAHIKWEVMLRGRSSASMNWQGSSHLF